MITFAIAVIAVVAGYLLRTYTESQPEILPIEVKTLVSAMRETQPTVTYESGIYCIHAVGRRVIRYCDSVRVSLLVDCGYTLSYCPTGPNF
jgi:hypothetical protein